MTTELDLDNYGYDLERQIENVRGYAVTVHPKDDGNEYSVAVFVGLDAIDEKVVISKHHYSIDAGVKELVERLK